VFSPHPFLKTAIALALEAGDRLKTLRLQPLLQERKADHSIVTNADKAADLIIRNGLQQAFPDHSILTEESGMTGALEAEYVWVVDPLDGTKAYVNGVAGFSVMIGLLKGSKPYAGVVFDPWDGHLYMAMKGTGTWYRQEGETKLAHVSCRKELPQMPVITSTGFPESMDRSLRRQLQAAWLPPINSVGVKVGFLVRQEADIYLNHHNVHYWDTCAPQIILEEAGGRITLTNGQELLYDLHSNLRHRGPTVASNNQRHSDLLKIVEPFMPTRPA
jgi:3'(2'), 5'-bisphosphate nucleotidase